MKGQSEIIVFILLFMIGTVLFISAVAWSRGMFSTQADAGNLVAIESFIGTLDDKIQNLIEYGGQEEIDYPLNAAIKLTNSTQVEIYSKLDVAVPAYWVDIRKTEISTIQERYGGDIFYIRLNYHPELYDLKLVTKGFTQAVPKRIILEKDDSTDSVTINISFK